MIKFTNLFLFISVVTLCASCNVTTPPTEFDFTKSESAIFIDNTELNANQVRQLQMVLSTLQNQKKEIYTEPTYQISFRTNGEKRYISIFEKEEFVFNGYFLDAWGDRMRGYRSNGYKLSNDLKKLIKEFKNET